MYKFEFSFWDFYTPTWFYYKYNHFIKRVLVITHSVEIRVRIDKLSDNNRNHITVSKANDGVDDKTNVIYFESKKKKKQKSRSGTVAVTGVDGSPPPTRHP